MKWQYDNYFGGAFTVGRNASFSSTVSSVIDTTNPDIGDTELQLASVADFPDPSPDGIMKILVDNGAGTTEDIYYKSVNGVTKKLNLATPLVNNFATGDSVSLYQMVCEMETSGLILRLEDDTGGDISGLTESAVELTFLSTIDDADAIWLILRHQNTSNGGDFYAAAFKRDNNTGDDRLTVTIYHHDASDHTFTELAQDVGTDDDQFEASTLYDVRFQIIGDEMKAMFRTSEDAAWEATDTILTTTDSTLSSGAAGFGRGINGDVAGDLYVDELVIDDLTA